ncbi:MAG: hypothetical protein C5B49_12635 [Bdellovibrio sp.]|nr:MAG: hypothetical protein C5B49_12635 [Bdellovibrio sp.]
MIYIFIILAVGGLRFYELALKPAHHDESINGAFIAGIWQSGWYNYDPTNYHGPLLFYLQALGERLFGWGIIAIRFFPVFFSLLQVFLFDFYARKRAPKSRWMNLVWLMSPGFFFYSRSGIHEAIFAFFLALAMIGFLEVFQFANFKGWIAVIWGLWGAMVLKETWTLLVASAGLSFLIVALWRRELRSSDWFTPRKWINPRLLRASRLAELWPHLLMALFALAFLFTGGFQDPAGMTKFVYAYLPWMKTGAGSGHDKSFFHWILLLSKYDLGVLAMISLTSVLGLFIFPRSVGRGSQWIFLTAVIHFLVYSAIPYKTPWCIISIVTPFWLAGLMVWHEWIASAEVSSEPKTPAWASPWRVRGALAVGTCALLVFVLPAGWRLNFVDPTPMGHEYVYVQTDRRFGDLMNSLFQQAGRDPRLWKAKVQIAGDEDWPMAWWLSPFTGKVHRRLQPRAQRQLASETGPPRLIPSDSERSVIADVDVLVANASEAKDVESEIQVNDYWTAEFPIRDSRVPSKYYVRKSLFPINPFVDRGDVTAHAEP